MGINYIGGCCGSVAVHIREMARALGKPVQERKVWTADYGSPMSATEEWRDYRAESGERYNPLGNGQHQLPEHVPTLHSAVCICRILQRESPADDSPDLPPTHQRRHPRKVRPAPRRRPHQCHLRSEHPPNPQ